MPKKANHLIKESNVIARARLLPTSSSVWDGRVIAAIAGRNSIHDLTFREQIIDIKELATSSDELSASQYGELKKAITRLTQSYFQITKSNGDFMNYPIFAKIGLEGNFLVGEFNPKLAEHYLELKRQFAIRSLPEFKTLSGTYSQRLFRYLNSWKNLSETTIPLNELHETLMTPPSFRENFKAFRIRVLETAHREITENTNLDYTWEPIRKGLRKVEAVRFIFDLEKAAASKEMEEQTQKQKELAAVSELQRLSNQCHKRLKRLNRSCKPRKSEKCNFCTTRGRMYAEKLVRETQGTLLLEDQGSL